jgi:ubiquinone/menaquinone biosynthesis C-methylase UbiE
MTSEPPEQPDALRLRYKANPKTSAAHYPLSKHPRSRQTLSQTNSSGIPLTEADSVLKLLWDQDAVAWDRYWVPIFRLFARDLVKDTSPSRGDVVLDLGTGSGVAAIEVSEAAPSVGLVVGIDRSDAMIALARKKAIKAHRRNVRFIKMNGEDLRFPDGFFDAAVSNCGIAIPDFSKGLKEILRVLKPGGVLVFNDWHLIDVKPHRIFGEALGRYRTSTPSLKLARERSALATMESFHHSLSSKRQLEIAHDAGFRDAQLTNRRYMVRMPSVNDYLKMRLCRATIRRETSEMSTTQRGLFLSELRTRLREFVKGNSLVFDWDVFYVRGHRPSE